jgi:hypothetical protein
MIRFFYFWILLIFLSIHCASAFVAPQANPGLAPFSTLQRNQKLKYYPATQHNQKQHHDSSRRTRIAVACYYSLMTAQEFIDAGVSFETFAPQFLWLPMILAPNSQLTKTLMGPLWPLLGLGAVHLAIVVTAATQYDGALDQIAIFSEVFDPSLSQLAGMQKLFAYPNFVAEEWPHVLIWDLFVGRAIWLDGIQRAGGGINTRVALVFCNLIGPPGLLIHVATCLLSGKGLPAMGYRCQEEEGDENDNSK